MLFSANQIVGLIEIETLGGVDSAALVALGREELSVGELLAWLAGTWPDRLSVMTPPTVPRPLCQ